MEALQKYPNIKKRIESLYESRCNEILSRMIEVDNEYARLRNERADASMALREILDEVGIGLVEKYSDSVYAQEVNELDEIYKQATIDVLNILHESKLL